MYETKVNQEKEGYIERYKERFGEVKDFIFTDYRGLTVEQISELRGKLRDQSAEYRVVKNNFAKLALTQMEYPDVSDFLVGPTAVALAKSESGPVVKAILDLGRDWPVSVKGGIIDGKVFNAEQVEEYSKLPTRDELIAKLMGTMNAPLQNLVYAMNGVTQKLVRVLQAVVDKKAAE
jgi:large subunit ribosomal protein L10